MARRRGGEAATIGRGQRRIESWERRVESGHQSKTWPEH
jgi:hypothetical protein